MSFNNDTAIAVTGVCKNFKLYKSHTDRIKQALLPHKTYHQLFHALADINFEVKRGETVAIIGRNGSGKSTLLQLICGTLAPSAGQIQVNGRVAALLELGAGFNPEFTGRENVYLNAAILGLSRAEITERLDAIIEFADIGAHIDQPVKSYSSGMYVRLAFSVIAHVDADILIIDEALAVGDAVFVQKCMRFLRDFQKNGTILFVSHDSSAVTTLCDRAIWLHHGRIRAQGEAKKVCESYLAMLFGADNTSEEQLQTERLAPEDWVDQRQDWINHSPYRNDLQIFRFDPHGTGFGEGGAKIMDVHLQNTAGQPLAWVVGGELVRLVVHAKANQELDSPIIGFYIKNHLGQELFGDNTFMSYAMNPVVTEANQVLRAEFEFPMPILPAGDYSISVAIANGTQQVHQQHHWLHDALLFRSEAPTHVSGLVGIPMRSISLGLDSSQ